MLWTYIDESHPGNLQEKPYYLIITAVTTKNPKKLAKTMRVARRRKLPPKKIHLHEVKAAKAEDKLRRYLFRLLNEEEFEIYAAYTDLSSFLTKKKDGFSKIYLNLILELIFLCLTKQKPQDFISITFDARSLKGIHRESFNQKIISLLKTLSPQIKFSIIHDSKPDNNNLQIADFIAWSIFQKLQRKNNQWYQQISGKIKEIREIKKEEVTKPNLLLSQSF